MNYEKMMVCCENAIKQCAPLDVVTVFNAAMVFEELNELKKSNYPMFLEQEALYADQMAGFQNAYHCLTGQHLAG